MNTLNQSETDIKAVCDEIADMLIKKNRAYGDSALRPIQIFSKLEPMEAIRVRLDDKLSRLAYGNEKDFNENPELDLLGYLILLRVARKRKAIEERKAMDLTATAPMKPVPSDQF